MPATRFQPGADAQRDDELDAFVRQEVESAYHPCGTARIGRRDDPLAVVDPECRVIGVEALRVADSSVFPRITNGNLNAPSIMVGEKVADHVLGRAPPPPHIAEPWINPRWRDSTADAGGRRSRRRARSVGGGGVGEDALHEAVHLGAGGEQPAGGGEGRAVQGGHRLEEGRLGGKRRGILRGAGAGARPDPADM